LITEFELKLRQAGFKNLSLSKTIAVLLGACLAFAYLLYGLTRSWPISLSVNLCVLLQLGDLLRSRIQSNMAQQNLEWPKYLDAISSATWSGTNLQQAILDCRNYSPQISRWAFDELERDLAGGMNLDAALLNLKTRLQSPVADRFVELARLASTSGGRGFLLALRSQANQLRLENATWQEIQSKQGWVIATARLAIFAPWLVLLMLSFRSETANSFATDSGLVVLGVGLAASLLAFQLVRFLARLPQRKRILANS
jgi:tight adherence protein B